MATINLPQVPFTLEGNTTDQKAYVDMVNALLRGPLYNEYASIMQYATATAEQVAWLSNAGQALYNLTHRVVWQNDYSLPNGGATQTMGLTRIPVPIDKRFNLKLMNEAFDLALIEQNIKNGVIADAISSVVQNKFVNLECELIQAIYDYCLADGQYEVIPFRSYTAENADDANKAFFTLNETLIELTNQISNLYFGLPTDKMFMVLGRRAYLGLTPAYLKVIGSQAQLKAMVNGELYENTAMGIPVSKSFHLEKTYTKGQVNRDKGYNFTNVNGLIINKQVWAYPINMDTIQQVLDNDTANPKWIGKVQYATPTILYPKTCKIILERQPTEAEIKQAYDNVNKTFRVPVDYIINQPKNNQTTPPIPNISKIDISKINKLDDTIVNLPDPKDVSAGWLKPKLQDVVLKAVKAVNSSLTESDFDYSITPKGSDWPIDITNDKIVEVVIEGKNNAVGKTKIIEALIKNS
ncbi:MAG: hypothetical protein EIB84_07500 [Spiroplasma poulsonii]|uniref:Uncharacterized protein n=2 Tax=Spiroplasma poulsonii TaxID=2138 RepID=A0A2P6FGL7_9MOLU|nr:hypothetical protein [Spiroplasma poulsonii]UXX42182.1 capsid protein [Spiroplasma phage MaM-2019a]KAF0849777.1 hypothetical protein MSROBK_024790 [Spiroplasma poulsonii]MBW1242571.1 hypothetical protein [Spiroplasma poulsonii]PQM32484.1 hypothetical protein SMSRO_SF024050 [Spiroplasma poulsonii]PWF95152.1 hypothetical protein SMSE_05770 [Spiroplasma poulsonii]